MHGYTQILSIEHGYKHSILNFGTSTFSCKLFVLTQVLKQRIYRPKISRLSDYDPYLSQICFGVINGGETRSPLYLYVWLCCFKTEPTPQAWFGCLVGE